MCGLTAFFASSSEVHNGALTTQELVSQSLRLISHRGPDSAQIRAFPKGNAVLAHARLSIIDLDYGAQPFVDRSGRYTIIFNGELYNYRAVKSMFSLDTVTNSDTEVVLLSYILLGSDCLRHFRGMFSFVIWDNYTETAFVARDRFGIKPLYLYATGGCTVLSSEIKGLLPFLKSKQVSNAGLVDYLNFQFTLSSRTLFSGVSEFLPAHYAFIRNGILEQPSCYWQINYSPDYAHTERWFADRLRDILAESVSLHCTSDVPIASYVSGGIDSTLISSLSVGQRHTDNPQGFVGRYLTHEGFDESSFALNACDSQGIECNIVTITPDDFLDSFSDLIWHLDQPVAGPGSLGQFIVSRHASTKAKVILGGQGGDEIFGGYTRYLLGYFEQCIKGAIEGSLDNGNYVVTYESIIPNLQALRQYKPLMQEFWSCGLFEPLDKRYLRLVNRANAYQDIIDFSLLDSSAALESFSQIFYADGTEHASYFDRMSHFDFRTLLPALLHVEDRVSMAHGLESRVPFLDHHLVEFAATIPADIKFRNGELKRLLPLAFRDKLPEPILRRKDKMGFPVPLNNWVRDHAGIREFVGDILSSSIAQQRSYLAKAIPVDVLLDNQGPYGRALWGLLCLEVWHRKFID
jgi:asparagine synthase (glutamine-hydrolysing)